MKPLRWGIFSNTWRSYSILFHLECMSTRALSNSHNDITLKSTFEAMTMNLPTVFDDMQANIGLKSATKGKQTQLNIFILHVY